MVIVFVVMPHVVLLQPQSDAAFHQEMVRRIMNHVVAEIAEEESRKRGRRQAPEDAEKRQVKNGRNRNAEGRRRDQPAGVLGIIMVRTVHEKMESFPEPAAGLVMEEIAMH